MYSYFFDRVNVPRELLVHQGLSADACLDTIAVKDADWLDDGQKKPRPTRSKKLETGQETQPKAVIPFIRSRCNQAGRQRHGSSGSGHDPLGVIAELRWQNPIDMTYLKKTGANDHLIVIDPSFDAKLLHDTVSCGSADKSRCKRPSTITL